MKDITLKQTTNTVTVQLDKGIYNELNRFSDKFGIKKRIIIENAIKLYIEQKEPQFSDVYNNG